MTHALALLLFLTLAAPALRACPIPVFRYALEYWEPDPYRVAVFHSGPLSGEAKAAADLLVGCTGGEEASANIELRFTDVREEGSRAVTPPEDGLGPGEARVIVRFPGDAGGCDPLWNVALTLETVRVLMDSPARREIVRRLLAGDSAVWIFLESGDEQRDDAIATLLQDRLRALQDMLKLPEAFTSEVDADALSASTPPVRLSFSVLHLARDDPREAFFVASLLGSGTELSGTDEPAVVPVFGRGRALEALVGAGINEENILKACHFLVGPCSCEAKALNPGVDLLMAAEWESEVGGNLIEVLDLPPLVGLGALAEATDYREPAESASQASTPTAPVSSGAPRDSEVALPETGGKLLRNMLIVTGLIVAAVAFLVVRTAKGPSKDRS